MQLSERARRLLTAVRTSETTIDSCQNERDDYWQLSERARRLLFGEPAFLRSRQQCWRWSSTVQCMSSVSAKSHVVQGGKGCASVFWAAGVFPPFWPLGTVHWWAPFLPDDVVLAGYLDRDDCHIVLFFRYVPNWDWQIKGVSETVYCTLREVQEVEGFHPVWSDGCGRFSQSDRFLYVDRRERRRSC